MNATDTKPARKTFLSSDTPLVSVVVPMYNEINNICGCLDSLLEQKYPGEKIEICVVDGESTDGSRQIVENYSRKSSDIRLLSNPDRLTAKSLNIGAKAAKGEVIIILGAHSRVKEDFISNNIRYMLEKAVPCVGGTQFNTGKTYVQQSIGSAMASPFGIMSAPYRYKRKAGYVDTVVYAAYHRSLFEEVGYFDEDVIISEDAEFNWRIRKAGHNIFFSPDIISYYLPRSSLSRLAGQFFRYGMLRVNVVKKHIDALRVLHLIPAAFVFLLAGTGILSFFDGYFRSVFVILWIAYGVYLLMATASATLRSGLKYLPVLPLAFMAMQLCFGAGFLVGLFRSRH